ncbi:MAG: penicillin-insensitive murein endopeptidase [Myxococcota bacterium]
MHWVRINLAGCLMCAGAFCVAHADEQGSAGAVGLSADEAVAAPARDSVSCGAANRGALAGAVELPRLGLGYVIPEPWWERGYRYGTAELIDLVTRAAAKVAEQFPGSVVGIGDLSKQSGGAIPRHQSHQSGRDVDIIFYAVTSAGTPFQPDDHMAFYRRSARATYAKAPQWSREIPPRHFDFARNWAFIKAAMNDPHVQVQIVLVSRRIRRWLLDYARTSGEPEELLQRAAVVIHRAPGDSHNDHMHLRIACPPADVTAGRCRNLSAPKRRRGRKWYSRIPCPRPSANKAVVTQPSAKPNPEPVPELAPTADPVLAPTADPVLAPMVDPVLDNRPGPRTTPAVGE